jgi:isopentenyl-diphosphate delta-isomerase
MASDIEKRKGEHVRITLKEDVESRRSAGFEDVDLIYCALPELDYDQTDTRCKMFGYDVSAPIYIEGMTGGYEEGGRINRSLAAAAEEEGVAIELGSMRPMIEHPNLAGTYQIRKIAKSVPIIANIGVAQLKKKETARRLGDAVHMIDADALAIHINPLQELVQPEGDRDFRGMIDAIAATCDRIKVPIIVKEVGAGINGKVAKMLENAGVQYVNICGIGGTSWTAVELFRAGKEGKLSAYRDFGIPTVPAIVDAGRTLKKAKVIASGGIRNGLDAAKSIALGAEYASAALPFLKALNDGRLADELRVWKRELRAALYLTGAPNIAEFRKKGAIITGRTAEYISKLKAAHE